MCLRVTDYISLYLHRKCVVGLLGHKSVGAPPPILWRVHLSPVGTIQCITITNIIVTIIVITNIIVITITITIIIIIITIVITIREMPRGKLVMLERSKLWRQKARSRLC